MVDNSPAFEKLVEEIKIERSLEARSHEFYRSLLPRIEAGTASQPLDALTLESFSRSLHAGLSYDDYKNRYISALRRRVYRHLTESNTLLLSRLDKLEKIYLRRLVKYQNKPMIIYKALTESEIRSQRSQLITSFKQIDRLNSSSVLSAPNWEADIVDYMKSLDRVKEIIATMSKDIVEWQKYIGDMWRLNIAVYSFLLAALSLFVFKLYDYWKAPRMTNTDGICVQVLHETGKFRCSFVTK